MKTIGRCCVCEKGGPKVRNIVMLHQRAPVRGTGWGCFVCGLPSDGAVAVICDDCLPGIQAGGSPKFVCVGYPYQNDRLPFADLKTPAFDHDMSKHLAARQ